MKKILLMAAALLAVSAEGRANEAAGGDRYGFHPALRKFFHIREKAGCGGAGCGTAAVGPVAGGVSGYGPAANPAQSGTLVFPNHPFVRSPRDFFQP